MKFREWYARIVLAAIVVVLAAIEVPVLLAYDPVVRPCTVDANDETLQKTIAALDGVADLVLKLSTSLVGFGAALLIGLKGGVRLTAPVRASLIFSMLSFSLSAGHAVWWRLGIAQLWLTGCLGEVTKPFIERRYEAHIWFFVVGLICLFALVFVAARARQEALGSGDSMYTRKAYTTRQAPRRRSIASGGRSESHKAG